MKLEAGDLGRKVNYDSSYNPNKLFPIAREAKRKEIDIFKKLPFFGFDIWNHYEVSWLNSKGKPIVALAEIIYSCDSENIIESKSMKLYFNSFNNTKFDDATTLEAIIKNDLEERLNTSFINVRISPIHSFKKKIICCGFDGTYLDELDIEFSTYNCEPSYLINEKELVEEILYSDLLRSNCLVTHQPDWCSIQIAYKGKKINHEGLLRYLVSFRNDNEFHEQCVEKIFMHIMRRCQPSELTVYGRSTRRGGLDINSYRSTKSIDPKSILNTKLCRQ